MEGALSHLDQLHLVFFPNAVADVGFLPERRYLWKRSSSIEGGYQREIRGKQFGGGDVQLQIDPMHVDLDDRISVLHRQIGQLKGVALEIETEAKLQNNLLAQLQNTMTKAQAGLKNNMRRLNKRIFQQGSNHVVHVVMFALLCFFLVYLWSKFSKI